jgi:hypothetical protein
MKILRLLCLLVVPALAAAQSWTLYYTDTEVLNSDNSLTITPTVTISGDDGGYLTPASSWVT